MTSRELTFEGTQCCILQRQRTKQRDVNANSGAIWQSLLTRICRCDCI